MDADPFALDGGAEWYITAGDFIELGIDFSCPPGGPVLNLGPGCPGPVSVDVTGMTPGGTAGIITSASLGSDVMWGGPCAGGATGLASPTFVTTVTDADGDGEYHFTPTAPPFACGRHVQFVDLTTCQLTNVDTF